jgi:transposase
MRCLKRRLSDVVYRQLVADQHAPTDGDAQTGPGGHRGATITSSAADPTPHVGTSDQPQPGPATPTLPARAADAKTNPASTRTPRRRYARAVNAQRPTRPTTLTPTSAGAQSARSKPPLDTTTT